MLFELGKVLGPSVPYKASEVGEVLRDRVTHSLRTQHLDLHPKVLFQIVWRSDEDQEGPNPRRTQITSNSQLRQTKSKIQWKRKELI
jgi:hypothetical protein